MLIYNKRGTIKGEQCKRAVSKRDKHLQRTRKQGRRGEVTWKHLEETYQKTKETLEVRICA